MTVVVSPDYETLTITSDYLTVGTFGGYFRYTLNDGDEVELDLSDFLPASNNAISISASDVFTGRTTFKDGVYAIEVEMWDENTDIETACIYIGTTSNCKAVCKYLETKDEVLDYIMKALEYLNDCDCDCSDAFTLYEALLNKLEETSTTTSTNDNTDCGCS